MTRGAAARRDAAALMKKGLGLFVEGIATAAAAAPGGGRAPSLRGAPARVTAAWMDDLLAGYRQDPAAILSPMAKKGKDLVAVRDITFTSICQHHLLPFQGRAHVAYLPKGRITGLSRLGRLVDCLSRRLQLQESLTRQIADALQTHLEPAGAVCILEAAHACVTTRGARKQESRTVTAAYTGVFRSSAARRREVLQVLRG